MSTELKTKTKESAKQDSLVEEIPLLEIREEKVKVLEPETTKKRKNKFVLIKHNSTDSYSDPRKQGEYGKDLFPGFARDIYLAALDRAGKNFYITGLDPEHYAETYEKEFLQESLIKLEKAFGAEVLDPFADRFWSTRKLTINQEETLLDLDNIDDLLTYWNIKGGGFAFIASSPEELEKTNARFYLEEPHITYNLGDDLEKIRDKAIRLLSEIDEGPYSRRIMFILHKNLITPQEGITELTPKSVIYKALRRFIAGDYSDSQKKKAPKLFIDAVDLYRTNSKKSEIIAIINDAIWYGVLSTDKDNYFKNSETGYSFKTTDKWKVIDELCKVSNQDELKNIMTQVQIKWNKY